MHWDFYTVLSVLSGIVLIAAAVGGPVVGTVQERLGIFALGAFSFGYGIWVAAQSSGFYIFSIAPAALAVLVILRAVQHAGQKKPQAGQPGSDGATLPPGPPPQPRPMHPASPQSASPQPAPTQPAPPRPAPPNRTAVSALRAAQPERIRQAVRSRSTAFCPAFQLPEPESLVSFAGSDYYESAPLTLGWSLGDGLPRVPADEELLGIWQADARLKVAIGQDLNPTPPVHGVSWVTVLAGTGLIALSRFRVMGIIARGDSLLGAFGRADGNATALWCMPLLRLSSVSVTPAGQDEGLILSSSEPAGHVTLTGLGTAEAVAGRAASVPARYLAEMINRSRERLSRSVPR
jgi:hypothetical protein